MVDILCRHADGREVRVRKRSPVNTKPGAEAFERQVREQLLASTGWQGSKVVPTVAEFAEVMLAHSRAKNLKPSSIDFIHIQLRNFIVPELGVLRVNELSTAHGLALVTKWREAGAAAKTIHNRLGVLRRMLSIAVEEGHVAMVPKLPALDMKRQADERKPRFLSFKEADDALDWCREHDPAWHAFMTVGLRTGLRIGELLALKWDDVDLDTRRLRTSYRERPRLIDLTDEAVEQLRKAQERRGVWGIDAHIGRQRHVWEHPPSEWVFCSRIGTRR